jgi:hypothetical protein
MGMNNIFKKTSFAAVSVFLALTTILYGIGYAFDIKWLRWYHVEAEGKYVTTSSSILPLLLSFFMSSLVLKGKSEKDN